MPISQQVQKNRAQRTLRRIANSLIISTALAWPLMGHATAQSAEHQFKIETQSLLSALRQFATQAGLQVLYPSEAVDGLRSPELEGVYMDAVALQILLDGSDLKFTFADDKTVSVSKKRASASAVPADTTASDGLLKRLQFAAAAATPVMSDAPAAAQAAMPMTKASAASMFEEVVVTATRRNERLMEVPQSITALTSKTLADLGADAFSGYARHVPSLDFVEFSPGQTRITVRGVSAEEGVATTSYYIDEIAVTSPGQNAQPDVRLFDIERVEVLRGPQGTLYGEGSMGGTIRVITKKPNPNQFEGEVYLSGATIKGGSEDYAANAMLNIPLVEDKAALRAVGLYRKQGGWIDNVFPGAEEKDTNSAESYTGRLSLLLRPTEDFTITGMAIFNRLDTDNNNVTNMGHDLSLPALNPRSDDYDLYNVTVNYDFGFATLTSASSYAKRDASRRFTDSQAALDFFNVFFTFVYPITGGAYTIDQSLVFLDDGGDSFTEEVRLVSNSEGRLKWTLGGFYRDSDSSSSVYRVTTPAFVFGPGNGVGGTVGEEVPGGIFTSASESTTKSLAFFGEATYAITPEVDFTAGIRWFQEKTDLLSATSGAFVFNPMTGSFVLPDILDDAKSDDFTPKASIAYHPNNNTLVYFTVARGYRSGGANLLSDVIPAAQNRFKPDTTINYELGGKFTLLDGKVTLIGALYYIDWKDLQIFDFDATFGLGYISNAGKAHSQGIELEIVTRPTDRLTLTFAGNLTEAELDVDIPGANYAIDGSIIEKGSRLPNVPKYKFGAIAEYVFPINASLNGVIIGDVALVGDSYSRMEAGVNEALGLGNSHQRSYGIGNMRAGVQAENWAFQVFVTNIWNEFADLGDDNFGGFHRNQPRTIGADFRFNF